MSDQTLTSTDAPHDEAAAAAAPTPGAAAADESPVAEAPAPTRLQRLEAEGDAAADFLEELLDIVDLDGDIDLDVENDRATVSVVGGDLSSLVGDRGQVLEALQELARLAVLQETGERSRLLLDVAGYRARRRAELQSHAQEAVATAKSNGEAVRLNPMNAFERKVVHDTVAAAGLTSESEGEEPQRRVVVLPPA
jgi:spoIIIJ-associated protein